MTQKQKEVIYYNIEGYSARQCAIICCVSDSYARRIINNTETADLEGFIPSLECITRRHILDHILQGAGYVYVPAGQKYGYVSLLAYLGFEYEELKGFFSEDISQFLYMAIHRSNKAWKDLDPDFLGVSLSDFKFLLNLREPKNCKKS